MLGISAGQAIHDVDNALVLPHLAAPGVLQQRQPWPHDEAVQRQAAVSTFGCGVSDDAAAAELRAVAQQRVDGHPARQHLARVELRVLAQRGDVDFARLVQRLAAAPCLQQQQLAERAVAFQAMKTGARVEAAKRELGQIDVQCDLLFSSQGAWAACAARIGGRDGAKACARRGSL
jgi:hypothetical protein